MEDFDEFNKDDFLTTIFENMEPYMDTYEVYTQLVKARISSQTKQMR